MGAATSPGVTGKNFSAEQGMGRSPPQRPSSRAVPKCGRLRRLDVYWHEAILVSKDWGSKKPRGDSMGARGTVESGQTGARPGQSI